MGDPLSYPEVDPTLREVIHKNIPKLTQCQYATKDQLLFLIDVAHKLGLYDAADWIRKGLDNKLEVRKDK